MKITLSIGVADLNAGEIDSAEVMMALADQALYAAKKAGRDRAMLAGDLPTPGQDGLGIQQDKVSLLSRRLAGLDSEFKDVFLRGVEELVEVLAERDPHMVNHSRKVAHYATQVATEMGLSQRVVKRIEIAAMLHDIGMLTLPDSVLLCQGRLDEGQMSIIRKHPLLGVRVMECMEFLEQEIPAVRYHHERYDGKGYPEGISGSSIPLTARILAIADTFDAMTSPRSYRDARPVDECLKEIARERGGQFDPDVVEAFLAVAQRLGDKLTEVPGLDQTEVRLQGA
jgi:putative nucleotidyltransferase with HDIG domain